MNIDFGDQMIAAALKLAPSSNKLDISPAHFGDQMIAADPGCVGVPDQGDQEHAEPIGHEPCWFKLSAARPIPAELAARYEFLQF